LRSSDFVAALEGRLIGARAGIDRSILAQIMRVSAAASRTFANIPRAVFGGEFIAGGITGRAAGSRLPEATAAGR
jgi:hypothetical protein